MSHVLQMKIDVEMLLLIQIMRNKLLLIQIMRNNVMMEIQIQMMDVVRCVYGKLRRVPSEQIQVIRYDHLRHFH